MRREQLVRLSKLGSKRERPSKEEEQPGMYQATGVAVLGLQLSGSGGWSLSSNRSSAGRKGRASGDAVQGRCEQQR